MAKDALRPGELHDVVDCQKIRWKFKFLYKDEFLFDLGKGLWGRPVRVAAFQPLLRQSGQPLLRRFVFGNLIRIFIRQFAEAKTTPIGNLKRAADRGGVIAKQAGHIGVILQPPLRIRQRARTDLINCDVFAHTGQHIDQLPAITAVH